MALLLKSVAFINANMPPRVISVESLDHIKGFIFAEAYKEAHVRILTDGILSINHSRGFTSIPQKEMPQVARMDSIKIRLPFKPREWVRVKSGRYEGDLGLVENVAANKSLIRLRPRYQKGDEKLVTK